MTDANRTKTILVVDDAEINRRVLRHIFDDSFLVLQAANGAEAMEILGDEKNDISAILLDLSMPVMDGFTVLDRIRQDERLIEIPVIVVTANDDNDSTINALNSGAVDVINKPFNKQIVRCRVNNIINRSEFQKVSAENKLFELQLRQQEEIVKISETDEKTGTYNKQAFCRHTHNMLIKNPEKSFIIIRWDIDRFKIFNDIFGTETGDVLLLRIGSDYKSIIKLFDELCTFGHWTADHFVACFEYSDEEKLEDITDNINRYLAKMYPEITLVARLGAYIVTDTSTDVALMCDRAYLALRQTKDNFNNRYAVYNQSMLDALFEEQEIINDFKAAIDEEQFEVYYQPQYNYTNRTLYGAEALVRWKHPQKGLIAPGRFIPVFESNGMIYDLDRYVWEKTCINMKRWAEQGLPEIPVAVNISRRDIFAPDLCDVIIGIADSYGIEHSRLRLEITESSYMNDPEQLVKVVNILRANGFILEMDDFGSGYSSLNTLKDVPVDIIKLDMKFIMSAEKSSRGGRILSSVIRMGHWLHLPIIAEGVENVAQAEYLNSMNCSFMQGYYFAKPMNIDDFEKVLCNTELNKMSDNYLINTTDAVDFFDSSLQSTLMFNSFVGGTAIVESSPDGIDSLRMNDKFFEVITTDRDTYSKYNGKLVDLINDEYKPVFRNMINDAIKTKTETECEVRCISLSTGETMWLHFRARLLESNYKNHILFIFLSNTTDRRNLEISVEELNDRLETIMSNDPGGIINFEIKDTIRVTYFNDMLAEMFGYTHDELEEMYNKDPLSCIYEEDVEELREKALAVKNNEININSYVYRHKCKDGGFRWVQITGRYVVENESGGVVTSAILIDINSMKTNKDNYDKLQKQKYLTRHLYDIVPYGILILKLNETEMPSIVESNQMARDLLGFSSEEQLNTHFTENKVVDCINSKDIDKIAGMFFKACQTEERISENIRIIGKNSCSSTFRVAMQKSSVVNGDNLMHVVFTSVRTRQELPLFRYGKILFSMFESIYEYNINNGISVILSENNVPLSKIKQFDTPSVQDRISLWCGKNVIEDDMKNLTTAVHTAENGFCSQKTVTYRYKDENSTLCRAELTFILLPDCSYLVCKKQLPDKASDKIFHTPHENEQLAERYRIINEDSNIITFDYNADDDSMTYSITNSEKRCDDITIKNYIKNFGNLSLVRPQSQKDYISKLLSALKTPTSSSVKFKINLLGKGYRWHNIRYVSVADKNGHVYRIVGQLNDINDEVEAQNKIKEKAISDGLTGLLNKSTAFDYIKVQLDYRSIDRFDALMIIDIDDFKNINDTYGHMTGDNILSILSKKIKAQFRHDDIVSRFGGDEFLIYMRAAGNIEVVEKKAEAIIKSVADAKLPNDYVAHCSIGAAIVENGLDFDELFNRADSALYKAKNNGKCLYHVWSHEEEL